MIRFLEKWCSIIVLNRFSLLANALSNDFIIKTLVSIDRISELYENLKVMEAQGGEETVFRGVLSDTRDELNRLPNLLAVLGDIRSSTTFKTRSRDVMYWINFILNTTSVNAKRASALIMGSGGLSEFVAELETLKDILNRIKNTKSLSKKR